MLKRIQMEQFLLVMEITGQNFVFNTLLSELYYGDSSGLNLPNNLVAVMKQYFETLCFAHGKPYTKPHRSTLMHFVNGSGSNHKCSERCFQGFPLKNVVMLADFVRLLWLLLPERMKTCGNVSWIK